MEKTVLVLESEENRAGHIIDIIHRTLEYVQVYRARSIDTAYRILMERTIDIFVVNVVVECENAADTAGMELAARIREIPKYERTPIIMISSLEDSDRYACKELNCMGYLDRSFPEDTMKELLQKASRYHTWRSNGRTLFFRKNKVLYSISVQKVVYIEKQGQMAVIHTSDRDVMEIPYVSLKDIIYIADSNNLFFCNRSVLVNKQYVYAVDATNRQIMLKEDYGNLDIGVTHMKQVQEELLESGEGWLTVRKNNVYYRIPMEEFVYGESSERTLHIHLRNGSMIEVAQKPIQYILEQEKEQRLLQGARSMVINKDYISGFDKKTGNIRLEDGRFLRIGRAYAGKIKEYCKQQEGKK